jgi:hypothetical protein
MRATETELAWAAGFIEADGCIHLSHYDSTSATRVDVIVVQKDRRPIDRLQRIFEDHSMVGVVHRRGGTATYYRVSFTGERAAKVLTAILPYLEHKREVAEIGIRLYGLVRAYHGRRGRGVKISAEEMLQRRDLIQRARTLPVFDAERLSEAAPEGQAFG